MKYLNISSFKKYFEIPRSDKILIYLVAIPNSYEREKIFRYILQKLNAKKYSLKRISSEFSINKIIETFQSPLLLGGEPLIIIDDVEGFSKEDLLTLNTYITKHSVNLLVGMNNKQASSILYSTIEKKGLILDLSYEKIWEKEKRFTDFVIETCIRANKDISSVVINALFNRVGLDLAVIEQEINKVISFVGEKKAIELEDIQSICVLSINKSIWQMAEDIVWEKVNFDNLNIDATYFHLLISAIRYQLQLGYKIAALIENNQTKEISAYFPKIFPRALEKKQEIAALRKTFFYKKGLKILFEIDLLSKTMNMSFSNLLDILKTKILYLYDVDFTS